MFYVYVLQSKEGKLYIGMTNNLKKRFAGHNAGQNLSTKAHKPWDIIFYEAHTEKSDASRREKYLKTTQGQQALSKMLRQHFTNFKNQGSTTG